MKSEECCFRVSLLFTAQAALSSFITTKKMLLFLTVCGISFLGSVHPGPVNLAVLQITLGQSRRAGAWLALGGSLPEVAYSSIAAGGLMLLPAGSDWLMWLNYAAIPILLGAGIAAFRQKPMVLAAVSGSDTLDSARVSSKRPFLTGLVLAGTNPQLLPFWSAVWLSLRGTRMIPVDKAAGSVWVFAAGTATGAFALLLGIVWLADRYRQRVARYLSGQWLNQLTGWLFIGMAGWQAVRLFMNSHP